MKTNPKICELLKFRFDNSTKGETNFKALQRLDFEMFLQDASGSTLREFNSLVPRTERPSAIATEDQYCDEAKINILMNTIEPINWYITATERVETIPHFTGVVQKINHELGKTATNIHNFD